MHLNLVAMLEPKRTIINCYKQNMSQSKIREIVGCSQAYVSKIIASYQLSGDSILKRVVKIITHVTQCPSAPLCWQVLQKRL